MLDGKKFITVINKIDRPRKVEEQENEIEISAMLGKNIKQLKEKIVALVIENEIDFNNLVLTNERQVEVLKNASGCLEEIFETGDNCSLDVLSMLVKKLWQTLGKITGNTENEDIIDLIFSKFCLGK